MLQLVDAGAIDLGASTVSGTYTVTATAGGGITNTRCVRPSPMARLPSK